jgi:hypothetical protein
MAIIGTLPNNIQNGQSVDANSVMADFNFVVNQVNANASPLGTIPPGTLLNIRVLVATQVYTPTIGANSIVIFLQGAGGAGGGAQTTGAGQNSMGTGGGAGALVQARFTSAFSGVTVTIGAQATGVAGANGNAGGTSTFGALATANGGAGGGVIAAGSVAAGGLGGIGGAASGGYLNLVGQTAPSALMAPASNATNLSNLSGPGAGTIFGSGGVAITPGGAGNSGTGFGTGGGGANNGPSAGATLAGGASVQGVCVIYEYS